MTQASRPYPVRTGGRKGGAGRLGLLFLSCAMVAVLAFTLRVRPLSAEPQDGGPVEGPVEETPDLFHELLASQGDGEWRGVLNRILGAGDAAWIGQVLGPLFRDRVTYAGHGACAAYTAAYLADHPEEGRILLGEAIVHRAHGDEAFLGALRSHITKGEGGWGRLLDHARELLDQDDARARSAAVFFLSHEDQGDRETVRREIEARARVDLPALASETTIRSDLAREYLDAFERILGYRFATLEDAVGTLEGLTGLDLAHTVLALSRRKSLPSAPDRQKLVEYGKRLVDDVVDSGNLDGLDEFLDPKRTPYAPLRRYAVQKAAQLGPQANDTWGRILCLILAGEDDAEVLRGTLALLERTGFAEVQDVAARLSAAVALRLGRRGPHATAGGDALQDRVRMAKLLGSLKVRTAELDELLGSGESREAEVLAELVRALGGVEGVKAAEVLVHYRRANGDGDRDHRVQVAVVDALGRPGFRTEGGDGAAAAAALREILTGQGEGDLGRAEDGDVRQHAIRSLGSHPGLETAEVLSLVVLGGEDAETRVAIVVLRRAGSTDAHAVQALGRAARMEKLAPERRIQALEALGELASAEAGPKELARGAVRDVLEADGPHEVRLEAAAAAAALADPLALETLLAYWTAEPDADRASVLASLVGAVAGASPEHDVLVTSILVRLGEAGAWDLAVDLLADLVRADGRDPLKLARARVLFGRSGASDGDAEARRRDLALAHQILDALLGHEPAKGHVEALSLHVRVLGAAGDLAEEDALRKEHYLEAVRRAVLGKDAETARVGLEITNLLLAPPLTGLLEAGEAAQLAEDRKSLEARLGE